MNLKDLDLDVLNLLQDFPKDQNNAVLYVRIQCQKNGIIDTFLTARSNAENITQMILSLIENKEEIKLSVFDAVLAYLWNHREDIETFRGFLKNIEQNKETPYHEI